MKVGTSEIFPRLFQIAQIAGKAFYAASFVYELLPRQRHIPIGIALKECESLDYYGRRSVKFRARRLQHVPLLARPRMERIV
jgi:hypothetical protein